MNLNTTKEEHLEFKTAPLHLSILGGIKLSGLDRLRVTLKIEYSSTESEQLLFPLRYNIDLYNTDQTEKLIRRIADYYEMELKDTRRILMQLINELETYRLSKLETQLNPSRQIKALTEEEINTSVSYLKQKGLLHRLNADIGKTGIVGEEHNRLILYLVYSSRKLVNPLHVITLGQSGAGKTHLQEKVADLIPDEDKIEITSLTQTSLYYFEPQELQDKLILIEDLDGATQEALYTIRELQSKKRITRTLTVKNAKGQLSAKTIVVHGKVTIAATTTKDGVYEDNSNRSLLLHVDTSKEQDEQIMNYQKQLSTGSINTKEQQELKNKLKDLQRMLQPVHIKNPYANHLELPPTMYNPRRSMSLYLSFIEAVTFIHQYQRPLKKDALKQAYIEVCIEDIQQANILLKDVFLKKSDEISAAARITLEKIKEYLLQKKQLSFYTKDVKQTLKFNPNNLKRHLKELEQLGYLKVISGSRYLGFEYKIVSPEEFKQLNADIDQSLKKQLEKLKSLGK